MHVHVHVHVACMCAYALHVMSMQEYDKQQAKLDKQGKKTTQAQPGAQAKLDLVRYKTILRYEYYFLV